VFLLSAGVQGWFWGQRSAWFIRLAVGVAALFMIEGGIITDVIGIAVVAAAWLAQKVFQPNPDTPLAVHGSD